MLENNRYKTDPPEIDRITYSMTETATFGMG